VFVPVQSDGRCWIAGQYLRTSLDQRYAAVPAHLERSGI
jgi:hypothetical protein